MPFQAPHKPLPSNKSLKQKQKQKQLQEQNKHEKMKPAL
ncbi:DNA replication protein DnaD [Bacillus thuringiensis]|nr:DNA replication protein DnaD [Bacillus cereus]PEC13891.1 DNA replication protein DnaD [Bacillus thuringiensis]PFC44350.1 DNA replication protein DnaD [Bacillus thuringiensis]PFE65015.1 DNA replication protein DnaD [Bacillus thuringiensis]PFJ14360.1 DNA replication protein DnaD [Bacillus thuringiensis]